MTSTTTPASAAKASAQRRQAKDTASGGPLPKFPRKLHTDAQVLAAVKWTIRSLAREDIAPDTARALVDALEKLMKLKRTVQTYDTKDEDAELLELVETRMKDLDQEEKEVSL